MNGSRRLIGVLVCAVSISTVAPTAASTPRPDAPSASPGATITTLGPGEGPVVAGTYRTEEINGGGAGVPPIILTLPPGWSSIDGWVLHRGSIETPTVAVQFWDVGEIYGHPCDWRGTLFDPGPSVADLTAALVDRPMRNATQPTAVTIDGREGLYLEWSVPAGLDFTDCDADGGEHYFESWAGRTHGDRYHQGPGQVDRLWILDVDGARLVIDGFDMPSATDAERQELQDVVASIRFEEPAASGAPVAPSASPTIAGGAAPSPTSLPILAQGPIDPGRHLVLPPAVGWAECPPWVPECPPEPPLARSLRFEITVPEGWEALADATVIAPSGGTTEGPGGAGFVIGWTTPTAGLHADPCQPVAHLAPAIAVGPTVTDFVEAVQAHPLLETSDPIDVELGGYNGRYFELTVPSDISACKDWRPFEPGIYAQGPDNLWSVWVIDVDGLRMIVLTEEFAGTPVRRRDELRSMVESIRFVA